MNGLLLASIFILIVIFVYLILQAVGCCWARHNRIKRGTEGLPGVDSDQAPRTIWSILGNILYFFYGLPCRLCCPNWQVHYEMLYPLCYNWFLFYSFWRKYFHHDHSRHLEEFLPNYYPRYLTEIIPSRLSTASGGILSKLSKVSGGNPFPILYNANFWDKMHLSIKSCYVIKLTETNKFLTRPIPWKKCLIRML